MGVCEAIGKRDLQLAAGSKMRQRQITTGAGRTNAIVKRHSFIASAKKNLVDTNKRSKVKTLVSAIRKEKILG